MNDLLRSEAMHGEDPEIVLRRPRGPFAWAIEAIRDGQRVTRLSWGDPRNWLQCQGAADGPLDRDPSYPTRAYIMQHVDGWDMPWSPTHADLLAMDWTFGGIRAAFPPGTLWCNGSESLLYLVNCETGDLVAVERVTRQSPHGLLGREAMRLEDFVSGGAEASGLTLFAENVEQRASDESSDDFARRLLAAVDTSVLWRRRIKTHHMLRGAR